MLPHQLPELAVKASNDARTITMVLKYIAFVAVAICTVAVCVLFVKVSILPAEPYKATLQNNVVPIKENKPTHKEQEHLYVVGVNFEFEPHSTIQPKLVPIEPVDKESPIVENNNLKRKLLKSHIFQSVTPTTVATTITTTPKPTLSTLPTVKTTIKEPKNDVEIVKPVSTGKTPIINEDKYLNQHPFTYWFPSLTFANENEQKESNEKNNDYNPFENFFNFHIKPTFDSEEIGFRPLKSLTPFQPINTFINYPSYKPNYDSPEEVIIPIDSFSKEEENFFNFPRFIGRSFFDSEEERSDSTSSSNEREESLEFPAINNEPFENLYEQAFSNFFDNIF